MQKIILILFCTIMVLSIKAQIFNPINWKSESILWSTYTRNPDLETSTLRPRMRFDYHNLPIFHDGYLYQVANNFDFAYTGYLLQKIDLATGEEIWQNNRMFDFIQNSKNNREYAVSPYINESKFGFSIFKEIPIANLTLWGRATIGVAEYNLNDGGNTLYETTSSEDTLNQKLNNGAPGLGRHTFVKREGSTFEYIMMARKCPLDCKKFSLEKYYLSEKGYTLDSIVKELAFNFDINRTQVYKIFEDKYLALIETQDQVNQSVYKIQILLLDNDLNVIEDNDITGLLDPFNSLKSLTFYHNGITNDKFNLYATRLNSSTVIYTFDTKGKLWEKIELPASNTALSISLPMIDGVGSVVAIADFTDTQPSTIKIYQSDGNGSLTLKEDLITDNPEDRFNVKAMFWTPDKNLLLHLNQIHVSQLPLFVRQDYHCNALLDTRRLGIISSVIDSEPSVSKNVYPNPAHDFITIPEYQGTSNIEIFDMMGRLALHTTILESQQIDISSLKSGFYNLIIQDENQKKIYRFMKP
jgi:Secretion system C-terminal sorting domain